MTSNAINDPEQERVQQFSNRLETANTISNQIVEKLTSFETRLSNLDYLPMLQKSIRGNYQTVQNINECINLLQNVLDGIKLTKTEGPVVNELPKIEKLFEYLESCEKVSASLNIVRDDDLVCATDTIRNLQSLEAVGVKNLQTVFSKLYCVDAEESSVEQLTRISRYICKFKDSFIEFVSDHSKIRSQKLLETLEPDINEVREYDRRGIYVKDSHPFLKLVDKALEKVNLEVKLLNSVIPKSFVGVMTAQYLLDINNLFSELSDSIIAAASKKISKHDFSDVFAVVDLVDKLFGNYKNLKIMESFNKIVPKYSSSAKQFFHLYLADLESIVSRQISIPHNATVHEMTSNTLNFLKRLFEFEKIAQILLKNAGDTNWNGVPDSVEDVAAADFPLAMYINVTLNTLEIALENKSRNYKKVNAQLIFLINNYYHILKSIRTTVLKKISTFEMERKFEQLVTKMKEMYMGTWQSIADIFTSSGQSPESIKDSIKRFMSEFEEAIRQQKEYTIADAELRSGIVMEIQAILIPTYRIFYDTNIATITSSNYLKYFKFNIETVENMISDILHS